MVLLCVDSAAAVIDAAAGLVRGLAADRPFLQLNASYRHAAAGPVTEMVTHAPSERLT